MKANKRCVSQRLGGGNVQLTFHVSELQSRVLFGLSQRYQLQNEPNQANMASLILSHALMDFDHLLPQMIGVERYCAAEGFENQQEFRESVIARKFPKPKPRRKRAK